MALPAFGVFLDKGRWGQGGVGEGTGKGEKVKEGREGTGKGAEAKKKDMSLLEVSKVWHSDQDSS